MEVDFGVLDDGGDAVLNDDVTFDFSFFDSEVFMLRGLVVLEIDLGEVTFCECETTSCEVTFLRLVSSGH